MALAFELATEAVRENPNQPEGRRALGFVKVRDGWQTPFAARQLNAGKVCHETFGWLPATHVERYERGERYYQGRWVKADEEARLRRDIKRGWRVESDHYVVTTNHSLEEGVRLARRLERFYAVWRQEFAGFVETPAEAARRFSKQQARREIAQHNVVYYRSREEYNAALCAAQPKIDMTLGIYFDSTRTAYFFAGEEQEPGTLYHEATHQLFHEMRPAAHDVGHEGNFWIVEGIACYMESLAQHEDYATTGGANAGRMPAARHRLIEDGFYIPLADLVRFGMQPMQQDPRLPRLYSQCAGLADFFIHDADGRYREALTGYLAAIYAGRSTTDTLSELTSTSYENLDRQYREFISAGTPTALAPAAAAH